MNFITFRRHGGSHLAPAALGLAFAAALSTASLPAHADARGETAQNRPFVSGGVSIEEARALERQRNQYRLWLVTADRGSGAWLAGAQAVVRDGRGDVVLDTVLDGPYLLVDLAPGRYTVDVRHEGQSQQHTVSVGSGGTRQMVVYFDTPAELSPDMPDRTVAAPAGGDSGTAAARDTTDTTETSGTAGSTPR